MSSVFMVRFKCLPHHFFFLVLLGFQNSDRPDRGKGFREAVGLPTLAAVWICRIQFWKQKKGKCKYYLHGNSTSIPEHRNIIIAIILWMFLKPYAILMESFILLFMASIRALVSPYLMVLRMAPSWRFIFRNSSFLKAGGKPSSSSA